MTKSMAGEREKAGALYWKWVEQGKPPELKPVVWRGRWVEARVMWLIARVEKGLGVWPMRGRWAAYTLPHKSRKYLGSFDTREQAVRARLPHLKPSWVPADLWAEVTSKVIARAMAADANERKARE